MNKSLLFLFLLLGGNQALVGGGAALAHGERRVGLQGWGLQMWPSMSWGSSPVSPRAGLGPAALTGLYF